MSCTSHQRRNTAILDAIESTDYDLNFAVLSCEMTWGAAVVDAGSSLFINPVGAMENINDTGSEYETLLDAGIEITRTGIPAMHHKYAIVDHSQALSDPTVVTGSSTGPPRPRRPMTKTRSSFTTIAWRTFTTKNSLDC